jgi:hypothetical protein
MAVGDTTSALESVNAGSYLAITPGSGAEWIIHNVHAPIGTSTELYFYDGSNEIKIDTNTTGGWMGFFLHCTNSKYYRIKNTSVSAAYLGYDGIVSK